MNRERFEALVAQAVESLPPEFLEKLENVDVVVEDLPSRAQLNTAGVSPGFTLLGLYEGIPLTERNSGYGMVAPDKITIFQKTIEEKYRDQREGLIQDEIRKVVLHEIAHHFGIDDARLEELEEERKQGRI